MIVTDCNIQVNDDRSIADKNIIIYRGDYNVQVTFTITQNNNYRYRSTDTGENLIESANASYGQILINNQDEEGISVLSDITPTDNGKVTLTIVGEYIDELTEIGSYDYQIRLFSSDRRARLTIPPIRGQLIVKEPLIFDEYNVATAGLTKMNNAIIHNNEENLPVFDDNGNYVKTQWVDGDIISTDRLNKTEEALYEINSNINIVDSNINNINDNIGAIETDINDINNTIGNINTILDDINGEVL